MVSHVVVFVVDWGGGLLGNTTFYAANTPHAFTCGIKMSSALIKIFIRSHA